MQASIRTHPFSKFDAESVRSLERKSAAAWLTRAQRMKGKAMHAIRLVFWVVVCTTVNAQIDFRYDASLGSFPDDQGWERLVGLPEQVTATVAGGVLSQSTLPLTVTPCPVPEPGAGRNLFWRVFGVPFSFEDGVVFETELRAISSQDGGCVCDLPNSAERSGIRITLTDSNGYTFNVGIQNGRVALVNDPLAYCNGPAVAYALADTTSAFRHYRLEINGPSAVLFIDGVEVASHSSYGNPRAGVNPSILIGDATSWSNSSFELRAFSVTGGPCGPADLDKPFGLLDLSDITAFATGFLAMDPIADLVADGLFDLSDINAFVTAFTAGCP